MPCIGSKFKPVPNETLILGKSTFSVLPHPAAPGAPFSAEGKRAVVFSLKGPDNDPYALKVFKKVYRSSSLLDSAVLVERFQNFPGMLAAKRTVVGPSDQAAIDCPDLVYSMLMKWVVGNTWNDILMEAEKSGAVYGLETALPLCNRFLEVMEALEQVDVAHTDIAPGNVMVNR